MLSEDRAVVDVRAASDWQGAGGSLGTAGEFYFFIWVMVRRSVSLFKWVKLVVYCMCTFLHAGYVLIKSLKGRIPGGAEWVIESREMRQEPIKWLIQPSWWHMTGLGLGYPAEGGEKLSNSFCTP